ncbi:MAG: VWA domain-containing protein [Prevotellaceae bacterium]|nr:VWA domain-containing protein [Prevotellaceae bacterium]
MFRFESPQYLYFLIGIVILALLFLYNRKRDENKLLKLGEPLKVKKLRVGTSNKLSGVKQWLLLAALSLIIIALSRPQMGTRLKTDYKNGIEIVIALDVSNSMLAQDVSPTRLDKAKSLISLLCDRLKNNKFALVVFAGNAYLQVPMSADNVSIKMFLDAVSPGMITTQGTSLAQAIDISVRSFSDQKDVKRAVVVITDGEDHEGGMDDAISQLKSKNAKLFMLGVGSPQGGKINIGNDFLRDKDGQIVVTHLNETMCKEIASNANGQYIRLDNSGTAQKQLVDELTDIQTSSLESSSYEEYNELYYWLLIIALCLMVIDIVLSLGISLHFMSGAKNKTLLIIVAVCLTTTATAQSKAKILTHKGNVAFNNKKDSLAIIYYKKAVGLDSTFFKAKYNLGNTYLRQGKPSEAMKEYQNASSTNSSKLLQKAINHNMGLVYYMSGQYDKAIDAYKKALRAQPNDDRTRYNLALAQYMQKKNKQNNPDNGNGQDKNNPDKNKNQDNKQNQNKNNNNNKKEQNMSRQNTDQMLRAVEMKERQTQEKLKRNPQSPARRYIEKNW